MASLRLHLVLTGANPCVQAAPCGDHDHSTAPPVGPSGRAALVTLGRLFFAPSMGRYLALPPASDRPVQRGDRIDDPPEASVVG